MNSLERMSKALRCEQPDRVPILTYLNAESPNISAGLKAFILANTDVFYTEHLFTGFQCTGLQPPRKEALLEDGWMLVTHDTEIGRFSEILKRSDTGLYTGYKKHIISDIADIDRLSELPYISPADNPLFAAWLDKVNEAGRKRGEEGAFIRMTVHSPLCLLAGEILPEHFAMWTIEHKEKLLTYMSILLERMLDYLDQTLRGLIFDPIFNIAGAEYAIPPLMRPTAFRDYVLNFDKPLVDVIHRHDRLIYYHCHGKVRSFIPGFIEMGADGLHPLEPVGSTGDCDLAEVKQRFGREICLIGNIQYDDFSRLSPAEMEQAAEEVVLAAKGEGGFILAPSCTPYNTPLPLRVEENISAFVRAGLNFGRC